MAAGTAAPASAWRDLSSAAETPASACAAALAFFSASFCARSCALSSSVGGAVRSPFFVFYIEVSCSLVFTSHASSFW